MAVHLDLAEREVIEGAGSIEPDAGRAIIDDRIDLIEDGLAADRAAGAGTGRVEALRDRARRPGGFFVGERFPTLSTSSPRLQIRSLTAADAKIVDGVFQDRLTRRWLPIAADAGPIDGLAWCTEMAAERRAMGIGDHLGIVRREDDALVGCLWTKRTDWSARSTEAVVAMLPEARGYGYAAEALDAVAIELIMQHDFHRIEMRVASGNTASRRVAEKAGFVYEGLLRNAGHVYQGRVDLQMWSLVAADLR